MRALAATRFSSQRDMAHSKSSTNTSDHSLDHDIDDIVERMRQDIPSIPYYLSVPSEYPYRLLNPALRDQWREHTWFGPHEEHLQYSTFVWRDSATSLFQLYPFPADDPSRSAAAASASTPNPSNGPKKKITLAAYKNKSRSSALSQSQTSQDPHPVSSPSASTPGPRPRDVLSHQELDGAHDAESHQAPARRQHRTGTQDTKTEPQADASGQTGEEHNQDVAMESVPWLPTSTESMSLEDLPPRLSPIVPAKSILHMPSPRALQRYALSSLVGSKSSPLQVTLSLPSTFATEHDTPLQNDQGPAAQPKSVDRQRSLIVKLRIPSWKQRKRKPFTTSEDGVDPKRMRANPNDKPNGEKDNNLLQNGKAAAGGSSQTSSATQRDEVTAAEWQAETVRLSKLGKASKGASTEVFRESEKTTDAKEQTRLRRIAGIRALEALLRFLQSFVAKSQSRPKPKALLMDWISFLPYSSNVVVMTRHIPPLEGLALLLQSVASAQIVAVCSSMRATDDGSSNKDEASGKEPNETLLTMHKYTAYTQQKAAEAAKMLTRKTLAEDYPKAYAVSLEQPLGSGMLPMPVFRMAVQLLDEWSSHQGIEWQPLDEGLCSRL